MPESSHGTVIVKAQGSPGGRRTLKDKDTATSSTDTTMNGSQRGELGQEGSSATVTNMHR
jgi:hypothetical protein